MDWIPPTIALATGIVISVVTSFVTVRLALRRFYSEKWWERKNAAYTAIIEALHHLREYADTNLYFSLRGKDLPPEGEQELLEQLQKAMGQLRLHYNLGTFVVSEEAIELLNRLFKELEAAATRTTDWREHLELKLEAIDNCLPEMRRIARKELKHV